MRGASRQRSVGLMKVAAVSNIASACSYHVRCILMSGAQILCDVFIRLVRGMPMIKTELWCNVLFCVIFTEFMIGTNKLSLSLSHHFITSCTENS